MNSTPQQQVPQTHAHGVRFAAAGLAVIAALWGAILATGCDSDSKPPCNTGSCAGAGPNKNNGSAGSAGSPGGAAGAGQGGHGGATSDLGTVTSCDVTGAGSPTCIEYGADYTASRAAGCNVLHGVYSAAPCDHASSSGGCQQVVGGAQTTYYYPPITTADVQVQCTNDGNATYVAPSP